MVLCDFLIWYVVFCFVFVSDRAAWYKLKYLYSASADTKVKEFIDSIEEHGRELLLQGITSKVKVSETSVNI